MRLYKIECQTEEAPMTQFVGTKSEGVDARKKLYADGFTRKEVVETEVDVPTDKAGLIAFLNKMTGYAS